MGFWNRVGKLVETAIEVAPVVMGTLQQEATKKQASMHQEAERRVREHEKKVSKAENSDRMSDPNFARKVKEEREILNRYYSPTSNTNVSPNSSGEITYKGLTVTQWNRKWIWLGPLDALSIDTLKHYNKVIGLYKMVINGNVVYVGKAIEFSNGGFRKRIRDYRRSSNSGRTHGSGRKIHENTGNLQVSILIVGSKSEDVKLVESLEIAMIKYLDPVWNVQHNR
ncbi:GIY-YIG nuclease family protein [Aquibacillus rhizosphaerae]|uniref:GIY-YIG domain-containing protein n=1 Tax=Aquibacillus rhizosphaerae TaxID=3051431 RepID=A0ABT7LAM1_9BACI|nr:hypothetical protein [Aquibacillus sp. LR5S19]MDL4842464.1 hypothetical protein [Aquibacillus sp. LR5S19]